MGQPVRGSRIGNPSAARTVCILLAGAVAACVTHAPMSDSYEGPLDLPASVADAYQYPYAPLELEDDRVRRRFGVTIREIEFPAAGDSEPLRLEYFDVASDTPTPVIVVLPIFNGNTLVTRYFARHFANQGWAAVAIERESHDLEENLLAPERSIQAHLRDYMRVLDWAAANPDFDAERIGVFGISLGGMDAVMLAALDGRINAVVAAMAGGDLSYLLMNTSYRAINRSVAAVLEESGMTREALELDLAERIRTEPLALAPYVDAENVLLVLTRGDWIVPFETQQALRQGLGQPEALYLPTGHRTSVFYFPLLRSTAHGFFARRFARSDAPVAQN